MFELEKERANPMVATISQHLINIRKKNIASSLSDFEGSAHKLEHVKTLNNIDFIDDARSTNINSVWYSIQSMKKPTVWITNINDVHKISDDLMSVIAEKVKVIVLQGVYNSEVYESLASLEIPVIVEISLEDAVRQAFYASDKGYVVLFAPGVAGTTNQTYREKGEKFQEAVAQL